MQTITKEFSTNWRWVGHGMQMIICYDLGLISGIAKHHHIN